MPTISTFFGIAIRMFYTEHPPPHFHVSYQRHRALISTEQVILSLDRCRRVRTGLCANGHGGMRGN
jgi:hypothetical protein